MWSSLSPALGSRRRAAGEFEQTLMEAGALFVSDAPTIRIGTSHQATPLRMTWRMAPSATRSPQRTTTFQLP
ncbi:hypothetical protein ADL06_13590 [Streptomyces sp. NRRL F-6491]|nr:hypothetical protein ADL06_13590 [Streptomyces sp. NRRL F-6491]KOX41905.1 hypothetical protein ADL08_17660 [Streptomyces sp. NRRL F-6492]